MKKVIISALFALITSASFSQMTRNAAYDILKSNCLHGNYSSFEILASNTVVPPSDTIYTNNTYVVSPAEPSWFFFVDLHPYADWFHPCKYVFVSTQTGACTTTDMQSPPEYNLDMMQQIINYTPFTDNDMFNMSTSNFHQKNVSESANEYAVIINGGYEARQNYPRYYNHCRAIYQMLVNKYHYDKDKIYVLMGNGTDSSPDYNNGSYNNPNYVSYPDDLDGDGTNDVQFSATYSNVSSVFSALQNIITEDDNVLVFVTDHGGRENNVSTIALWNKYQMTPSQFAQQINKINAAKTINLCLVQCYSGGFISSLSGNNRVITTSCSEDEVAYAMSTPGHPYSEFCYRWISATLGYTPDSHNSVDADYNNDGYVSMSEAFNYARAADTQPETPHYYSPYFPNIGPYLTLNGVLDHHTDLMIRDSVSDNGTVPSNVYYMWESPDIWIEDMHGNVIAHPHGNTECKVCVRIKNNDNMPTYGGERLFLNWAKAGCDLRWDYNWSGANSFDCGPRTGSVIGDPNGVVIPIINANSSKVVKVTWAVPRAEDYQQCTQFDADRWHFCLAARVHDDFPIVGENQTNGGMGGFTVDNNNVAWKNLSILDAEYNTAVVSFSNPFNFTQRFRLHFKTSPNKEGDIIFRHADVLISLDEELVTLWKQSGGVCIGGRYLGGNRFLVKEPDFRLENIIMPAGHHYTVEAGVRFYTQTTPRFNEFEFDIIEECDKEIIGGEHYRAIKDPEKRFKAIALEDKIALSGDNTLFTAQAISEDAQYTWFSTTGDTLAVGDQLQTTQNTTKQYILEVVSEEDNYKDVDTVTVTVRRAAITAITPNPANNQTVVSYRLASDVASANIVITNAAGQVMYSAPLDVTQTSYIVNLEVIPVGQYVVRIESQGTLLDSKTLIVK